MKPMNRIANCLRRRWRRDGAGGGIVIPNRQAVILYGIIYMGFLLGHAVIVTGAEGVFVYYDSYEYYRDGLLPLTDSRFWSSGRTPVSLIFYKLFGGYEIDGNMAGTSAVPWAGSVGSDTAVGRVSHFVNDDVTLLYGQTVAYIAAFSLLAFACAKCGLTGKGRLALFLFPLLFSFVPSVLRWNFIALSESFAITLSAAFVAVWIRFLQTERLSWLASVAIVALLWVGVRSVHAYVLVMIALVLIAILIRSCRSRRTPMMALCAWFVCIFILASYSTDTGRRWLNPLYNNILQRILPVPEYVAYFSEKGMPVTPELMMRAGTWAPSDDWAVYTAPQLEKFRSWSLDRGKMTYIQFLVTHITYSITAPVDRTMNGLIHFAYDLRVGPSKYLIPAGSVRVTARIYLPIAYGLTAYFAFSWWRRKQIRRCPYLAVPLIMILLSVPHAWLSWHGDAAETERHTLVAYIQFQLGFMLLLIYAWDHGTWRRPGAP